MSRCLRAVVLTVVLTFGLAGVLRVSAQISESGVPEGATDAAALSFTPDGDVVTDPIYTFIVFTFDDDDTASQRFETLPGDIEQSFAEDEAADDDAGDDEATPDATGDDLETIHLVELSGDEFAGLDDLGDEARAFDLVYPDPEEFGGGLTATLLIVRDGDRIHLWTSLVLDFGLFDETATPTPIDPRAAADGLASVAGAWFGGDKPDDGALVDQLPQLDDLPAGYTETDRAENLQEYEDADGDLFVEPDALTV